MKLLLTSAGITNPSIRAALLELLGKPIEECTALVNSTASYPLRRGPQLAWSFIAGQQPETPMAELGWKSVGVLELTALPSIPRTVWLPRVEQADVLLVNGGDTIYLDRWMRESGLADLLPSLDLVYVGLSAGSLVMSPSVGGRLRFLDPACRGRRAGRRRLRDLPAPRQPRSAGEHHGRCGAVGGRPDRVRLRDRRPDRDQGGRWGRRGDLGGALAAVRVVVPSSVG